MAYLILAQNDIMTRIEKASKNPNVSTQPQANVLHVQTKDKENKKVECPMCKSNHYLNKCPNFIKMTPQARYEYVKSINQRPQGTFINNSDSGPNSNSSVTQTASSSHVTSVNINFPSQTLLSTAVVRVINEDGHNFLLEPW